MSGKPLRFSDAVCDGDRILIDAYLLMRICPDLTENEAHRIFAIGVQERAEASVAGLRALISRNYRA